MIHYNLLCDAGHGFDGWYRDSATFDRLVGSALVGCPTCGGTAVRRALMTPAVATQRAKPPADPIKPATEAPSGPPNAPGAATAGPMPAEMVALLQRLRERVEKDCDHVGRDFADEARKMHRGETDRRGIYGDATESEVEALADEGIEVGRIPWVPRADG